MKIQTLEKCFTDWVDMEIGNIVETVEDRIKNEILTAMDNKITPRIELAARSINASIGRDTTSITAISEHGDK